MTIPSKPILLKTTEAAEFLGIKPNTLAIWRLQGKGPVFKKMGKLVKYLESDLNIYLEENTHTSTSRQGLQAY